MPLQLSLLVGSQTTQEEFQQGLSIYDSGCGARRKNGFVCQAGGR